MENKASLLVFYPLEYANCLRASLRNFFRFLIIRSIVNENEREVANVGRYSVKHLQPLLELKTPCNIVNYEAHTILQFLLGSHRSQERAEGAVLRRAYFRRALDGSQVIFCSAVECRWAVAIPNKYTE